MKRFLAGAFTFLLMLVGPVAANGATINVSTTNDTYGGSPGTCSLREAITAANTNSSFDGCSPGSGVDLIRLPAGNYKITIPGKEEDTNTSGDFDIKGGDSLTIEPAGDNAKVVIDGNGVDRVLDKDNGNPLILRNLRITGGNLTGVIEDGAGIRVTQSTLVVDGVTIDGGFTPQQGGGIAIYSTMDMINSTVSGNRAAGNGGGLYLPGGSSANIRSSTITRNVADADDDGFGYGGGFAETAGLFVNFHNVINADNQGKATLPGDRAEDCHSGPFFFPRYVIQTQPLGPLECLVGFNPGTNQVADPNLGPLADNGGQTPTHALRAGSPAIGAGGTAAPDECPSVDQNGRERPAGSCDIGAAQFFKASLPGLKNPTNQVATFDGKNLHIRLKCPARFKPKCVSKAVPLTKKKGGKAMGAARKVTIKPNKFKRVSFLIKPAFRAQVEAMTLVNKKRLVVRQVIRSKRVGKRKAKKPARVFHIYKVRVKL